MAKQAIENYSSTYRSRAKSEAIALNKQAIKDAQPKAFRSYTSAIPVADGTVVFFNALGFANTIAEKISMARHAAKAAGELYAVWPGNEQSHVFKLDIGDVLVRLVDHVMTKAGLA